MALSAQAGSAESDYPLGSIELGTGEDTRYKQGNEQGFPGVTCWKCTSLT